MTDSHLYFLESRPAAGQPWQRASMERATPSKKEAMARLASRRRAQPGWEHRLMERIIKVIERPADETLGGDR
ncbi:hypothetical protein ACWIG4_18165 [Streptomyces sp. NPDC002248]